MRWSKSKKPETETLTQEKSSMAHHIAGRYRRYSKMKEKLHSVFAMSMLIMFSPLILFPFVTGHGSIQESFQMWKEDLRMCLKMLGAMK